MICKDRVVIVTGAGRGRGRAHALEFARQGAKVVVNDLGVSRDGAGEQTEGPAAEVVAEIRALGGEAVASPHDIATDDGAKALVQLALDTFGRLDVLVNNAGFLRDRMLINLGEDEWDAVMRVHLKGHFLPLKHAGQHWRAESKAGRQPDARIINTSSGAGLLGSVGQGNYSAAKAGIVGLTLVASAELGRYGVTVNAIAPAARTRMTEEVFAATMRPPARASSTRWRPRTSPRPSCGSARRCPRTSPAGSSNSRAARSPSWRASGTARRSTRASAGTRRTSTPSCASCWPNPPLRSLFTEHKSNHSHLVG